MTENLGPCPEYLDGSEPAQLHVADTRLSIGQGVADRLAALVGSWPFFLDQSALLGLDPMLRKLSRQLAELKS